MAMSWCFEDEATPLTRRVYEQVSRHGAFVPHLWRLEVSNVLLICERKRRLTREASLRFLSVLRRLPIQEVPLGEEAVFDRVLNLGREARLTAYDAAYLFLALEQGSPLATLDRDLAAAARLRGVAVTG